MNDKKQNFTDGVNDFDDIFDLLEDEKEESKLEIKQEFEEDLSILKSELDFDFELEEEDSKWIDFFKFLGKYILTSFSIFAVLMILVNFSAYYQIAQGYFNIWGQKEIQENLKTSILESTKEENLEETEDVKISMATEETKEDLEKNSKMSRNEQFHSMDKLLVEARNEKIDLSLEITPYENRIVIPVMGKNIPLLEASKTAESVEELEKVFMKDLEDGVIRYPGSATPWEDGNTFIFGHSSNFPWAAWDYNDVFANLDALQFRDEIIIYYNQKKYVYEVMTKKVIRPWDVKILKRDMWKSEVTLMTCFPVWTTLNRLIVIGSLKSVESAS